MVKTYDKRPYLQVVKWIKVGTVSTFNLLKVDTVSTFNLIKVETVSTFNWLMVETVSTFKHFLSAHWSMIGSKYVFHEIICT